MRALLVFALVAACGDNVQPTPPEAEVAEICATPRTGVDPVTGEKYVDQQGSLFDEMTWVRSWIHDYYLWYREVPNASSYDYAAPIDYFAELKTHAITKSGREKDPFHFTYQTDVWEQQSLNGVEAGYGAQFVLVSPYPPRETVVAYTQPGSAGDAVFARGDEILAVDGADLVEGDDIATLNAGLFPATVGEMHTFLVRTGDAAPHMVTLTSASVTDQPVQHVTTVANGAVGYVLFNEHIVTSEAQLIAAIQQLQAAGVTDLVIDLRYNGGGLLAIASELAYMVAGPTVTTGHVFDRIQFNDKYPDADPIGGGSTSTPFLDMSVFADQPVSLPHLDLPRVFVLTSSNTCSASEAVMNGLMGVGVSVIQIGDTTCGKPYGFYPQDNCGTTFFSIQFQGVNDMGFGAYADGFSPWDGSSVLLPGCYAPDDFQHALGDPAEARLAAALAYRATGVCPAEPATRVDGKVVKPLWLQNRIQRVPRGWRRR